MSRAEKQLKIYVAALTRKRPEMLDDLLASWAAMDIPSLCSITYLIVENDSDTPALPVVDRHRKNFIQSDLRYVQEPELGIPFGRNRAAREAIEDGADLLLFVDDDEVTAKDWLKRMLDGYRKSNAMLLGAPLRARRPKEALSYMQSKMYENIEARYRQKEERAKRRTTLNSTNRVTIVTNNWLADLAIFRDHNIWFDQEMRFTGGTDSKLYAEIRKAELPTGWVDDAFVYETIPPERLSFWYQLKRAMDQSNTNLRRKGNSKIRNSASAIAGSTLKIPVFILLIAATIITNGKTLLSLARNTGWIAGRISYLIGYRSKLYANTTGF
ncbi:GT2 family glycosyltransferase [Neorhizobium huautlense]|uniref:GT2 family glycosyltransferase n=1 Tax=Neorhizobium huautlense TaxID=67774 RepID=A0ABT9Q1X5_9HYPH|nr:glycosyltransferase [Neorhizobium huautlense]MDP9840730.1 GT2 family glycosyltransferase [Neorhizobium huautlense]